MEIKGTVAKKHKMDGTYMFVARATLYNGSECVKRIYGKNERWSYQEAENDIDELLEGIQDVD